jgi:hypothetical protein
MVAVLIFRTLSEIPDAYCRFRYDVTEALLMKQDGPYEHLAANEAAIRPVV